MSIGVLQSMVTADELAEQRLERLLSHLPDRLARSIRRLRQPRARWKRIPVACLFLVGAAFAWLPILGIWMLPVGLLLLSEDLPFLRGWLYAAVNWLARRKPAWFQ